MGGTLLGVGLAARWWRRRRLADLRDQVVVITGGSRGLGLLLAEEFARQGARLALTARDAAELERARAQVIGAVPGTTVLTRACDSADAAQVRQMIERVTAHFGRVDVLVNNAGVIMSGPLLAQTEQDFSDCMDSMFWGTYHATMAVLPQMLARGAGRIVNIASIGGKVAVPHLLSYSSAKFAVVGFSEGLRAELARHGILVTTVCPGLMRTGSPVNAYFKGRHELEYALFAPLDSLPGVSISARRAARQIVTATRRGQSELLIGLPAHLLTRVQGLFPGMTGNVLALVNGLLPGAVGSAEERRRWTGRDSATPLTESPLTALSQRAADATNQRPGLEAQRHSEAPFGPGEVASPS